MLFKHRTKCDEIDVLKKLTLPAKIASETLGEERIYIYIYIYYINIIYI